MEKRTRTSIIVIIIVAIVMGVTIPSAYLISLNTSGKYLYTDSTKRMVAIPSNPQRIISMSPSITETLYELGVDDRVVGVTDYCNYPAAVSEKTSIGGFSTPNLEIIADLDPDLIIASDYEKQSVDKLASMGIPVVVFQASTLDEIIDNIELIGELVNAIARATEVTSELRTRMNVITAKTDALTESERVKCYLEVWEEPQVVGGGSFLNDLIEKAGGINIFSDQPQEYPTVSNEAVISNDPEVIFITEHSAPWYSQSVCERTGYEEISACKNNRVYQCDDDVYLRPGPRIIDALEEMTELLHPNL